MEGLAPPTVVAMGISFRALVASLLIVVVPVTAVAAHPRAVAKRPCSHSAKNLKPSAKNVKTKCKPGARRHHRHHHHAPAKPRPVTPPAPAPVAPPPPPPASPPPGAPTIVAAPYTCNGPVNNLRVVGSASNPIALVNLRAGCTGSISFDIHITSGGGDGVKVQPGVHDLAIGPSRIICDPLANTSFHQDGVQVQGGSNVTFYGLAIICPYVTGQGAAGFYIDGKDFSGISNVVCDACNLEHLHYGAMFTGPAPGSGVRNSIIHQGALTGGYFAKLGPGALDTSNTLAPACNGATVPC
jgi:hypothetical protein